MTDADPAHVDAYIWVVTRHEVDYRGNVTEGDVVSGRTWIPEVGDSTHYHARYVRPGWGRRMIKVDRIGAHIFYRTRFGGWS